MACKIKWLERDLIRLPMYWTLCTSQKELINVRKSLKVDGIEWPKKHANVTLLENSDGRLCAVVCISGWREHTLEQNLALLVHEATHVWQYAREYINERNPSIEFEAYAMQAITQTLFEAFMGTYNKMVKPVKDKKLSHKSGRYKVCMRT